MKHLYILLFVLILISCGDDDATDTLIVNNESGDTLTEDGELADPINIAEVAKGFTISELRTMVDAATLSVAGDITPEVADEVLSLDALIQAKAVEVAGTPDEAEVAVMVDEVAVLVVEVIVAIAPPPPPTTEEVTLTAHTYDRDFWLSGPDTSTFYSDPTAVAAMDQTPVNVGERTWVYEHGIVGRTCKEWYAIANFVINETSITDGTLTNVQTPADQVTCVGQGGPNQPLDEFNGANITLTPSELLGTPISFHKKLKKIPEGTIITIDEFGSVGIVYSLHYTDGRIRTYSFQ